MWHKITGRENEQQTLERCYMSDIPEFIAIYGRRRVGKTFLVRSLFDKKKILFS
ncbi:MAG: ATP-binding protein [Coxiellaceae bacterium]|jgi:AAA+ ATPase superfamily predicted ATPase|nr:ATP-binding protein [Coxiellaceae bacterium]